MPVQMFGSPHIQRRMVVAVLALQILSPSLAKAQAASAAGGSGDQAASVPVPDLFDFMKSGASTEDTGALLQRLGAKVPDPDHALLLRVAMPALQRILSSFPPGLAINGPHLDSLTMDGHTQTTVEVSFRRTYYRREPVLLYCASIKLGTKVFQRIGFYAGHFYQMPEPTK